MILVVNNNNDKIGKLTKKLIKYFRKNNIEYYILNSNHHLDDIKKNITGIIFSGSKLNLSEPIDFQVISNNISLMLRCGVPILGICFGFQIMCLSYGGKLEKMKSRVDGLEKVQVTNTSLLFNGLPSNFDVCSFHGDRITKVPKTFEIICKTDTIIQGIQNKSQKRYGLQFHPESKEYTHTILDNFIKICNKEM
jgi:GMP synthase (glutamine-hydrolysing)